MLPLLHSGVLERIKTDSCMPNNPRLNRKKGIATADLAPRDLNYFELSIDLLDPTVQLPLLGIVYHPRHTKVE